MTRDPTIIAAELIATGLTPGQTALLMELVLSMSTGQGGESATLLKRRAWDKDRKARQREADREARKMSTGSGGLSTLSTGNRVESGGNPPDFSSGEPTEEEKNRSIQGKERKKERGSRLLSSAREVVPEEMRSVAIENGCPPDRVDALWAEFVDYWSEIPGRFGCKLSWVGTWRNRVKQVFGKGFNGNGKNNGHHEKLGYSGLAAQIRQRNAERENGGPPTAESDADDFLPFR